MCPVDGSSAGHFQATAGKENIMKTKTPPSPQPDVYAALTRRMRGMWSNLEAIGVAVIVPPEDTILILRKPSMAEFRNAAHSADVPEPRSWEHFYELTFGSLPVGNPVLPA
jgi:hypothetical protein